jgi:hypothetical protein
MTNKHLVRRVYPHAVAKQWYDALHGVAWFVHAYGPRQMRGNLWGVEIGKPSSTAKGAWRNARLRIAADRKAAKRNYRRVLH